MRRTTGSLHSLAAFALLLGACGLAFPARHDPPAAEPLCLLYLDPYDYFTRVMPPEPQGPALRSSAVLSNITVNYSGFTPQAQAAFQAAVDIWQTQVKSTVPLVVDANFADLGNTGLLGSAGSSATRNFTNTPRSNTWFLFPIANTIAGSDLAFGTPTSHIRANFNSTASWSYATDGTPVSGKVDFISVVLHELGHGLGFLGSASVGSNFGSVGASGSPYIYDVSVVDSAGTSILDATTYPNGSATLASLLTGSGVSGPGLFWNGPSGVAANGGARPQLYAPGTYQSGSTYSHLDDATYPAGDLNSLMTHAIGTAEVIHTPGPIVLGMFGDMGWSSQCSFGLDQPVGNVGAAGGAVTVTLSTTSGCAWTASTPASFVAITAGASGTASAVIRMTVAANAGTAGRVAAVTIGDQTFTIAQAGIASCTYSLSPSSVNVGAATSSGTTILATTAGCAWTAASSNESIATVSPASGVGPATISYNVLANPGGGLRSATLTIGGQSFTISQMIGPIMSVDRSSLRFGGVSAGTAFSSNTGAQTVHLTQAGTGTVTWTAVSSVPWLTVSPASGTGSATLTVSTAFAPGLAALQTASVTLTLAGAGNTLSPIAVTQAVFSAAQAASPSGSFDTPADGSAGITGSLAVTGWALDDVDIARVRILRDPGPGETPGVLVYVGDASLVEGARPDVQALMPSLPRNYRAGWGYLMLTNVLPSLGTGTFRLTAIADDLDGHSTVLGTKTITCANSSAITPFGAIDTPAQGQIVSGVVNNFGWVLSPGLRRADVPGGGTVSVVIDGVIVGSPAGWGSRSDLTSLFASTQYSGIAGSAAVFTLDTTLLANGVHTIAWLVTDNQGASAGVGSRYFTVANGGGLVLDGSTSFAQRARPAAFFMGFMGRRDLDVRAPYQRYDAGADGVIAIDAEELDRIELQLGAGATAYARVDGALKPLPIGSHLEPADGTFTWQPGAGFVGAYDFVLAGRDVRIVLHPKGSGRVGPQVVIDPSGPDIIAGWAADLDSRGDTGIQTVHVWAYPSSGGAPIFVGVAEYGGARPDVAAVYGERFLRSGYGLRVEGLPPGTYDLAVFAYSSVTGGFVPAKTVRVSVR